MTLNLRRRFFTLAALCCLVACGREPAEVPEDLSVPAPPPPPMTIAPSVEPSGTLDLLSRPFRVEGPDTAPTWWDLLSGTDSIDPLLVRARGDTLRAEATGGGGFLRARLPEVDPIFADSLEFWFRGTSPGMLQIGWGETTLGRQPSQRVEVGIRRPGHWERFVLPLRDQVGLPEKLRTLFLGPPDLHGEVAVTGLRISTRSPAVAPATLGDVTRRALALPAESRVHWNLDVSAGSSLQFAYGVRERAWQGDGDGTWFRLDAAVEGTERTLWSEYVQPRTNSLHRRWLTKTVDLSEFAGQNVELSFSVRAAPPRREPFERTAAAAGEDAPVLASVRLATEEDERPNIVLIVIDTLRASALGHAGGAAGVSPALDALARDSLRFTRAYSTSSWTHPATASILTGLLPHQHGLGHAGPGSPWNAGTSRLPELLRQWGYATAAVSNNHIVSPAEGFHLGFDVFDCSPLESYLFFGARRMTEAAQRWLDEVGDQPFFLYLHYFDPHDPYQAPPPFTHRFVTGKPVSSTVESGRINELIDRLYRDGHRTQYDVDPRDLQHARELYQGEVLYSDHWIGLLLDELSRRGLDGSTHVLVTSDHGEEFYEHGYLKHAHTLYEELLHVPLLIRLAGRQRAGDVVDLPVSLTDVLPTVLSLAGYPAAPPRVPGRDLMAADALSPRPIFAATAGRPMGARAHGLQHAVLDWPWKYIRNEESGQGQLFQLEQDPGERQPVEGEADVRRRLDQMIDAVFGGTNPAGSTPVDPALLEKLKALGYVE